MPEDRTRNDDGREVSRGYCRRFGKIAVDFGFITPEQLKEALSEQVDDNLADNPHRLIGKIFFDKKWMSYQQIEVVLRTLFSEEKL